MLVVLLGLAAGAAGQDFDRWYTLDLMGQRSGWMHAQQETKDDRITSTMTMSLEIRRGATPIGIRIDTVFTETTGGKPLSMHVEQRMGLDPVIEDYTYSDTGIEVVSRQNGQERRSTKPLPEGSWLTPAAAAQYTQQRLKAGADKIVTRSINPMSGAQVVVTTRTDMSKTTLDVLGENMAVTKSTVVSSEQPMIKTIEYLDEHGVPVRSDTMFGGMGLAVMASDKQTATRKVDAPEMMLDTFVKPSRPIASPRRATKAAYTLTVRADEMPALPNTGSQTVHPLDNTKSKVSVLTKDLKAAPEEDTRNADYLSSSAAINTADEKIKELKDRALKGAPVDPAKRAETLRRFVHRHINGKGLMVTFATASEVARSRQGDCTEHGVLLAALLRADGIPARVVSGLIYAEEFEGQHGIFGYHMWAQALLEIDGEKRWVDLDGTLPDNVPYDATHIALAVSALNDADGQSTLLAIAPLIGNVDIQVDSCE